MSKRKPVFELDDPARELIAKLREGIEYHKDGNPVRDVLDEDDFIDTMYLLVEIVDSGAAS